MRSPVPVCSHTSCRDLDNLFAFFHRFFTCKMGTKIAMFEESSARLTCVEVKQGVASRM